MNLSQSQAELHDAIAAFLRVESIPENKPHINQRPETSYTGSIRPFFLICCFARNYSKGS